LSVYEYEGVACDCDARKEELLFMNVVPDMVVAIFTIGLKESTEWQARRLKLCDERNREVITISAMRIQVRLE